MTLIETIVATVCTVGAIELVKWGLRRNGQAKRDQIERMRILGSLRLNMVNRLVDLGYVKDIKELTYNRLMELSKNHSDMARIERKAVGLYNEIVEFRELSRFHQGIST